MKKQVFKDLLLLAMPLLFFASCSTEELENAEMEEENKMVTLTFMATEGTDASAKLNGPRKTTIVNNNTFMWTLGDRLWIDPWGYESVFYTDADNNIIGQQPTATFMINIPYTARGPYSDSYQVYYTGQGNGSTDPKQGTVSRLQVEIAAEQRADRPNDPSHIATSGDCGTALAQREGNHYTFNLDHKAAYLNIFPYLGTEADLSSPWSIPEVLDQYREGAKLLSITITGYKKEVNVDEPTLGAKAKRISSTKPKRGYEYIDMNRDPVIISGTYSFDKNGLGATPINGGMPTITFFCGTDGFDITTDPNKAPELTSCYVVMHPTSGDDKLSLEIEYMVYYPNNPGSEKYIKYTRIMSLRSFLPNSLTKIRHKLFDEAQES